MIRWLSSLCLFFAVFALLMGVYAMLLAGGWLTW